MHEVSHEYGTDDGEAGDIYNDAHSIGSLMNEFDLSNWSEFTGKKGKIDKKLANQCGCE